MVEVPGDATETFFSNIFEAAGIGDHFDWDRWKNLGLSLIAPDSA